MTKNIEVRVPDIGGFSDVGVIDVLVGDGQRIDKETPLITLETEKAAMDVPSPAAGRIAQMKLKAGDKVSQGSLILLLEVSAEAAAPGPVAAPPPGTEPGPAIATAGTDTVPGGASSQGSAKEPPPAAAAPIVFAIDEAGFSRAHASPSVRKLARELGVDLSRVAGSGPKGRIMSDDVKAHVKRLLTGAAAGAAALPKVPQVDFAKFGPVQITPLSRIQKISGARLQASWINLPHVTQHEEADITDLEIVRGQMQGKAAEAGVKLTLLAYIVRACVLALREFPRFNASLDASGDNLVLKQYVHIGFAADTPNGLVVPVIRDADRLGLFDVARALATLSAKARAGKLTAAEMQGGGFTISSLGGIGGMAFTPIINAPEVAILGVSRSVHRPVFANGAFVPRLMLPLSLSYDHRVIDGAAGARFVVFLAKALGDAQALQ
ncbi:MAG TPA: 2-oxo acid dehydrogenase subunit E2 [Steroidobacteraceae bacterium]|nr:2-oxo acid dehydrogenase subunit E2 [Steroidobacteraceae bacterium]